MTVYKRGGVYSYNFTFRKKRYNASTGLTTKPEAEAFEATLKKRLRERAAGVAILGPLDTPRFQDWAEIYVDKREREGIDTARIEFLLRVVLRFCGEDQDDPEHPKSEQKAPYHDLRLGDFIADPFWLERFERWMHGLDIQGQTRNHYRSQMSQMFKVAMSSAFRGRTNVQLNPFAGVERDRRIGRKVTVPREDFLAWLRHASYHVRLALAIAALAPKLRLENVLALDFRKHLDRDLRWIRVDDHKTVKATGEPLIVAIDDQLREILQDRKRRWSASRVVVYRGEPVKSIRGGVRRAATRAGLTYGRDVAGGVTFHTIRHTMATMLAELDALDGQAPLSETVRRDIMGHRRLETTQQYTHLRPVHQIPGQQRLSAQLPLKDIVTAPRLRAVAKTVATRVGDERLSSAKRVAAQRAIPRKKAR